MAAKPRERGAPSIPSGLLTDSYQLSMLQAYLDGGMRETAVFELFVRRLPPDRAFLVAAGLEQALEFLETLAFTDEEIEWLRSRGNWKESLLSYLRTFRFSGDVHAMPEGTIFFANEPVFRVSAPIPEAQLAETRLMNLLHFQTLVASKAARCVLAAQGRRLVDFGLRRAHGAEAGLLAARASYLAGFDGTSNILAEMRFGVPVYGTMAHSFIEAHDDEIEAFEAFARSNPENVVLLIDTYDTEIAAERLGGLARRLAREGIEVRGIRIDSGDLAAHAAKVRSILDRSGLAAVRILASGSIDEYAIRDLLARGAPIDGFGVGTHLTTSEDSPFLDCAYKLQAYAGKPRFKLSEGKLTYPGAKQVYRRRGADGRATRDMIAQEREPAQGDPLLEPVMKSGRRLAPPPPIDRIRKAFLESLERLPEKQRSLVNSGDYPVRISELTRRLIQ